MEDPLLSLTGDTLLDLLRRAHQGEDPEQLYMELAELVGTDITSQHPPGTIGVCADEMSRFSAFLLAMVSEAPNLPYGSRVLVSSGRNIARNCNRIVDKMVGDWCLFMGDDHVWTPGMTAALLDKQVDVVVPLCLMRQYPFSPVVYKGELESGAHEFLDFDDLPETGLVPVHAAGGAGMLIRKEILDRIERPVWSYTHTEYGVLGEDLSLCRKIRKLGVKIHLALDVHLGHLSTIAVHPKYDGKWKVHIDFNSGADE